MTPDTIVVPLLRAPFFAGLTPRQLKRLALTGEQLSFKPGERLIDASDAGDAAYLILCGSVEVRETRESVGMGTLVSELSMLVENTPATTVIAEQDVLALRFTRSAIHELMAGNPDIADYFVQQLTLRLQQMADQLRGADEAPDQLPPWAGIRPNQIDRSAWIH